MNSDRWRSIFSSDCMVGSDGMGSGSSKEALNMDYLERVSRKDEDENFCVILQSTFLHISHSS